jgi:peroxin-3
LGTLIPGGELDQEFVLLQGGLPSQDAHVDPPLRSLIVSTCQYVSSADFGVVLRVCLDRGTDILIRGLREEVYESEQDGRVGQLEKVRLAAMLPAVARWSHLATNGIPNELVEVLNSANISQERRICN